MFAPAKCPRAPATVPTPRSKDGYGGAELAAPRPEGTETLPAPGARRRPFVRYRRGMSEKPPEKTEQQRTVERVHGVVSWGKPKTDGFMRTCLELVGVSTRGTKYSNEQLVRLCNANGLPFTEADAGEAGDERR